MLRHSVNTQCVLNGGTQHQAFLLVPELRNEKNNKSLFILSSEVDPTTVRPSNRVTATPFCPCATTVSFIFLYNRLAAMYTNVELEAIRDRKDKIQSRLYCKMILSLAEPVPETLRGHYATLATLFKCSKLVLLSLKRK